MSEDLGQELLDAGFNTIDVNNLDKESILQEEIYITIFSINNNIERTKLIIKLQEKAKELKVIRSFDKMLKVYQQELVQNRKRQGGQIVKVTNPPLDNLKCGEWIVDDFGVYKYKTINFEQVKVSACSHPIIPIERLINVDTNMEKIKLAFFKDAKWQSVVVDRATIANKSAIVQLANRGIEVTSENAKELVTYISDMVSLNINIIPCNRGINRFGWVQDGFSPYLDNVKYDGDLAFKELFEAGKEKGDFKIWKDHCIEIRKKSKIAQIMLATSFAAPLLEKLGINCFCLHLWGGTGTGKTVALMLAMSIWGDPEIGKLVRTLNATQVALARTAGFLYNIPFAGDELQAVKNRWDNFDNLIMFLTEGVDRNRGKAYGGIEEQNKWKCNFIFTGEEPITQQNSGGGVKNRVLEIEATEKIIEDGNYTSNLLRENYGFAGKIFVENLPSIETLKIEHKEIQKQILQKYNTTDKQAIPLAIILLTDKLATDIIFKDSNYLCIDEMVPYLNTISEVDITERAYDWLGDFIEQNKNKFSKDSVTEFWGLYDTENNTCYMLRKIFDEALNKNGFSSTAMIKKFAEKGYIQKDCQGKFTVVKKIDNVPKRFVKIYLKNNEEICHDHQKIPF